MQLNMVSGPEVSVGVLLPSSPRYISRRLFVGTDSSRSERDGARNTKI